MESSISPISLRDFAMEASSCPISGELRNFPAYRMHTLACNIAPRKHLLDDEFLTREVRLVGGGFTL